MNKFSKPGFTTTSEKHDERLRSSSSKDVGAKARSAFTLIELLVVIAIIGLLSSVVLASLSGARESAQTTRLATDFRQIETAMTLWMQANDYTRWPHPYDDFGIDDGIGLDQAIQIEMLAAETNLSEYLTSVPDPSLGGGDRGYIYWRRGGVYDCDLSGSEEFSGVSIFVVEVQESVREKLDEMFDGGNGGKCGKLRYESNGALYYKLSPDFSF